MNIFNYIATAVRTLPMKGRRNVLKIMTLGVGLAVGLVLASKVCFEKTFDDFYKDADRIYYLNEAMELNGIYRVYPQVAGGVAPEDEGILPADRRGYQIYIYIRDRLSVNARIGQTRGCRTDLSKRYVILQGV